MRTRLIQGLALVLLLGAAVVFWYSRYPDTPGPDSGSAVVTIPAGAGVRRIQTILVRAGVVRDDPRFLVLARLSGLGRRLRAGEYLFSGTLTPRQILAILAAGRVMRHRLTVVEGLRREEVADLLAREQGLNRSRFLALTRDRDFIRGLGLSVDSLEGYLFPDTYLLTRNELSEDTVIRVMVGRFFQVWHTLGTPPPAGLDQHQVVTLASLVEKETAAPSERPLIARVFLNRLARGMRLQSDPTVIYALGPVFSGPLRRADLATPSPYNTYLIPGLPPGPICSPGRAALKAVLRPADSPALYFVARGDGTHVFSRTLAAHNRAVREYRRRHRSQPHQTGPGPRDSTLPRKENSL